jgi:phosphoribosylformimino-5-aminoimidazole carboxamide ribotide isomerase
MILYPAIDLKDGQCVRVVRGDLATATVFNPSPADQARRWAAAGFSWLHVVDLNGSVAGRSVNADAVRAILAEASTPVQLGGGIRSLADAADWFEAGVAALIVTDIDRDGSQSGFDIEVFGAMADAVAIPVIAAGGLANVDDIHRLRARAGTPIAGAVLGRALYAGAIDPRAALLAAA